MDEEDLAFLQLRPAVEPEVAGLVREHQRRSVLEAHRLRYRNHRRGVGVDQLRKPAPGQPAARLEEGEHPVAVLDRAAGGRREHGARNLQPDHEGQVRLGLVGARDE